MRLDRAVVERGLARSRSHAQELIAAGRVQLAGVSETKAGKEVPDGAVITVSGEPDHYVSRAAHKLIGVLDTLEPRGLRVDGLTVLDAGASTGGFTQVVLERGAARVVAVDVGHGQLHQVVADDDRVVVVEGFNVRDLNPQSAGAGSDVVVGDLSFISLTLVIPALAAACPAADFLLLIKPQFELSRSALDKHGVVTKPADRAKAIRKVCVALHEAGLAVLALEPSVLPGPRGNVEFFVWARGAWQAKAVAATEPLESERLDSRIVALVEGRP